LDRFLKKKQFWKIVWIFFREFQIIFQDFLLLGDSSYSKLFEFSRWQRFEIYDSFWLSVRVFVL